ncbi:DUF4158 domain-containing protein [Acrocarpospora macrocephala]|nr:DUF4158 domain-containing protein [Acrocarpospora macrocephala]
MPFEFLSDEQVARYGRFLGEPSVAELEEFFRLDRQALVRVAARRRAETRLGWAVQWGTVRMLGVFLTEDPTAVPVGVVEFVAGPTMDGSSRPCTCCSTSPTPATGA